MPELIVLAKSGYGFAGERKTTGPAVAAVESPTGAHGYLNTDPEMQAIFIASGYGIRKGVKLEPLPNTRIAATLAYLLGVQLPNADGPIKEVLQ